VDQITAKLISEILKRAWNIRKGGKIRAEQATGKNIE
jgi:hypothetical protein